MDNHTHSLWKNPESSLSCRDKEHYSRWILPAYLHPAWAHHQQWRASQYMDSPTVKNNWTGQFKSPIKSQTSCVYFGLFMWTWSKFVITWRGQQDEMISKVYRWHTPLCSKQINLFIFIFYVWTYVVSQHQRRPLSFQFVKAAQIFQFFRSSFKTCSSFRFLGCLSHSALQPSDLFTYSEGCLGEETVRTKKEPLGGQRDLHDAQGSTGPVSKTQQISSMSRCSLKASDVEFAIDD